MKPASAKALSATLALMFAGQCFVKATASHYEFRPGSRQAVLVPDGPTYGTVQQGAGMRQGVMTGPSGMTTGSTAGTGVMTHSVGGMRPSGYVRQMPQGSTLGRQANAIMGGATTRDFKDTVTVQGIRRKFLVHLPSNYNKSRPIPAVLVFAGLQMSGESMSGITGMNGVGNRNDFMVIYCESQGGEWQDGMKDRQYDDVAYIQAVLAKASASFSIDHHRIYAVGLSNGGYFAQLLACSMPDKIAAVAVVASTGMEQALTRSKGEKAIPIVFFLGTEDPLVNWGDNKIKDLGKFNKQAAGVTVDPAFLSLARYGGWWAVPELMSFWTNHNRCPGSPSTSYEPDRDPNDGMRVKKEQWGSRGNAVVLYSIEGGGHTWPGCIFLAGQSKDKRCCMDIDTSELIWQFFRGESR